MYVNQEIIIVIIGVIAFGIAGWKLYKTFSGKGQSRCDNCAGCAIKDIMKNKKQANCKDFKQQH